tara:strand:+ start:142 stop:333 length:192 start_codon:yes stop_codon:yes gene_type:complete
MTRKIFYNGNARRRLAAVSMVLVAVTLIFSVGVYAGRTWPDAFSVSRILTGGTAYTVLAAAEF